MRRGGALRWVVAGTAAALVLAGTGCGGDPDPPAPAPPPSPSSSPPAGEPGLRPVAMPEPGPGQHELTVEWDGGERQVLLDAPDGYRPDQPTPLVLVLHGSPGNPEAVRNQTSLAPATAEHGMLVAYPAGHLRRWRANPGSDSVDDLGYLIALVDLLVAEWNAAPEQVYAAGFSNGAAMAWRLAVEAADVFAAVAPVSGSLSNPPDRIEPAEPVSVVGFVGLDDRRVVDAASLDHWRDQLDCDPEPPAEDGPVARIEAACADGSEVVEYRLTGAGHVWPEQDSYGIDASRTIAEFFSAHGR